MFFATHLIFHLVQRWKWERHAAVSGYAKIENTLFRWCKITVRVECLAVFLRHYATILHTHKVDE